MPELPEVETTTNGLKKKIMGLKIKDIWTDLSTKDIRQKNAVANPKYFPLFKHDVIGRKVISVGRRAKNILINLSGNKTILIHMKMTGHLLFGRYKFKKKINKWLPNETGPLQDPYNRFVHILFSFSNHKMLAFSDSRKFGKVTLLDTHTMHKSVHLKDIGPEPLARSFLFPNFKTSLIKRPNQKIKIALMDQSLIAGIGNIYSDEILWRAGIHPESTVSKIKEEEMKLMFKAMKELLLKGIDFGGDSMSDYRNIDGERGKFQLHHKAYRKTGEKCSKINCTGVIRRKVIGSRSAHFCSSHQKLFL
ncbi:MAG: DNA-formamidopyrimidine glycosylase [Candidatus Paceibacterota bacterium]